LNHYAKLKNHEEVILGRKLGRGFIALGVMSTLSLTLPFQPVIESILQAKVHMPHIASPEIGLDSER
jgi:hypothetical protein